MVGVVGVGGWLRRKRDYVLTLSSLPTHTVPHQPMSKTGHDKELGNTKKFIHMHIGRSKPLLMFDVFLSE